METEDLRRLVGRDASQIYSVLMRDRADEPRPERRVRRLLHDARLLFLSLSEKLSPRRRLVFALSLLAAALGFMGMRMQINTPDWGFRIDASPLAFLLAIAGLVFLLASELVDRVLVRDEVEVAQQLQKELLPKRPPELAGWSFANAWRTANDIGGDYHRFETLADGRMAIVVADASGHGMAAGLLMAITDTSLRIALDLDPAPAAVAALLHRALQRTGDRRAFVTLFYARLDPASGALDFVSAGHPSPIVRRRDGTLEEPASGSLPLGLATQPRPVQGELTLQPGDRLVICTDGVFEAPNADGDAFGWDRLREVIASSPDGAAPTLARVREALRGHVGDEPPSDDRTLVVVERLATD